MPSRTLKLATITHTYDYGTLTVSPTLPQGLLRVANIREDRPNTTGSGKSKFRSIAAMDSH